MQLAFADEGACQWRWLRRPAKQRSRGSRASPIKSGSDDGWEVIADAVSRLYTCKREDLGCQLRVECTPAALGCGMPSQFIMPKPLSPIYLPPNSPQSHVQGFEGWHSPVEQWWTVKYYCHATAHSLIITIAIAKFRRQLSSGVLAVCSSC